MDHAMTALTSLRICETPHCLPSERSIGPAPLQRGACGMSARFSATGVTPQCSPPSTTACSLTSGLLAPTCATPSPSRRGGTRRPFSSPAPGSVARRAAAPGLGRSRATCWRRRSCRRPTPATPVIQCRRDDRRQPTGGRPSRERWLNARAVRPIAPGHCGAGPSGGGGPLPIERPRRLAIVGGVH